ncbi:hypothetical protein SLEP1_g58407 [Rubroshorea leprosula]|uniref:Uncharacterized protein n=1 Tax=Rubroshorea leprosula TaxID=152421 RepID=A0AAV5MQG1_9ROSI|nr:hypothetical protein SLEP1_g58407 [Rubroshorea leprosula]
MVVLISEVKLVRLGLILGLGFGGVAGAFPLVDWGKGLQSPADILGVSLNFDVENTPLHLIYLSY